MKTKFIFIALVIIGLTTPSKAQQTLTVDMSHASNYLSHGRSLSSNLACFQPGIYYGLKTGTTIMGWASMAWDRTANTYDEWNIIIDQNNNLLDDQKQWNINLHGFADYWYNPNDGNQRQDFFHGMFYNAGIHFPLELSQNRGLTLTTGYDFFYYHEIGKNTNAIRPGGIHEFLVKFNKSFKRLSAEYKAVISNNRGAVSYSIDPGWAFISQHLSVLYTNKYISLRPSINYQRTLQDRLPTEKHLVWFTLGVTKTFEL